MSAAAQPQQAPELGLRARKKAQVESAIAEAALALFAERGFDAVTADEIAAAAQVSRSSFFRYFATKEDVVLARRRQQLERFRDALAAQSSRGAASYEGVRAVVVAMAADYQSQRVRILAERRLVHSSSALVARDLELDRAYEEVVAQALTPRGAGASARHQAHLCAAAMMGVVRVCIDAWAERGGRANLVELGGDALVKVAALAP